MVVYSVAVVIYLLFFFSSRRRHTRCALVTGVQTCALPIFADSEAVTAELTRDYTVNRDVYQDLLKRRESARVSMNLDADQDGPSFAVQNPAEIGRASCRERVCQYV